jgi:hypothetical protein
MSSAVVPYASPIGVLCTVDNIARDLPIRLTSPPMDPRPIGALILVRIGDAQPVRRLVGPCRAVL